jgi:hypothetical protein
MLTPEVVKVLQSINTEEDLKEAFEVLREETRLVRDRAAAKIRATGAIGVGMQVSFTNGRNGPTLTGIITKVNRTTASVLVNKSLGDGVHYPQTWRVGLAFLKPVVMDLRKGA